MIPLRDTNRSAHFPVTNWLLLIANGLVFFYELSLSQGDLVQFSNQFALVPARLNDAPVHYAITVLTSMFMHAGWFHVLSNLWVLFIFGDNVEDRMGPLTYLFFYLLCGTAAALLQTFIFPGSRVPVIGASGAIAGVLGAYMFYFPRARVVTLIPIFFFISLVEVQALIFILFWFVIQLFSGLASIGIESGGVAWWAHIGGFLVGLVLSPLFMRRRPTRQIEIF